MTKKKGTGKPVQKRQRYARRPPSEANASKARGRLKDRLRTLENRVGFLESTLGVQYSKGLVEGYILDEEE